MPQTDVKSSDSIEKDAPSLNVNTLKDIFDKMTEIDSDPNSTRARDYYQKLEDIERKNPNKKKTQIIIKTMKRGRTVSQQTLNDPKYIGQKLTEEEAVFQRKYFDYKDYTYPEVNPVEMKVKDGNKMVSLASYRYPAQTETRKGIIHYVNGYGDYALRYAFMAQQFAKAGYDFVTLDPKGFGHSEGTRGYIESVDRICEDQMKFNTLIEEKFDGKGVPKLQLGYSMGGLVSLRLSAQNPKYFSGNGLITPYLGFKDKKIDELANSSFLKSLDRFVPWLRVPIPEEARKKSNVNKFLQTINNDPLIENRKICVHTMVMNQTALKQFSSEAEKIETPFIMILGGKDTVVDNKAAKDFFNLTSSKITDKDIVVYDDGDHFMALDNDYSSMLIKDLIAWYNTHI